MKPRDDLIVSSTEPTGEDRKKVWMKFNENFLEGIDITEGYYIDDTGKLVEASSSWFSDFIEIKSSTNYYISMTSSVAILRVAYYDKDKNFISRVTGTVTKLAITTPSNAKYIKVGGNNSNYVGMKVELGTEKLENKIYVKNNNDIYEEFTKKSEEVYSTEEVRIGTWIDGKKAYRRVYQYIVPSDISRRS